MKEYEIKRTNRADSMTFFKDKEMSIRLEYSLEMHRLNKYLEGRLTTTEHSKANESIRQLKVALSADKEPLMFGMEL